MSLLEEGQPHQINGEEERVNLSIGGKFRIKQARFGVDTWYISEQTQEVAMGSVVVHREWVGTDGKREITREQTIRLKQDGSEELVEDRIVDCRHPEPMGYGVSYSGTPFVDPKWSDYPLDL